MSHMDEQAAGMDLLCAMDAEDDARKEFMDAKKKFYAAVEYRAKASIRLARIRKEENSGKIA